MTVKKCFRCKIRVYPNLGKEAFSPFHQRFHFCPKAKRPKRATCPGCGLMVTLINGSTKWHTPRRGLRGTMPSKEYLKLLRKCRMGGALPRELAPVLFAIADLGSVDEN